MRCPDFWSKGESSHNRDMNVLNKWYERVNNMTLKQVIDDSGGEEKVSHNIVLNTDLCLRMFKSWLRIEGLTARDTPLLRNIRNRK